MDLKVEIEVGRYVGDPKLKLKLNMELNLSLEFEFVQQEEIQHKEVRHEV